MNQILQLKAELERLYIAGKIQHYESLYCGGKYTARVILNGNRIDSKAMTPDDDNTEVINAFKDKLDKQINGETKDIKVKHYNAKPKQS